MSGYKFMQQRCGPLAVGRIPGLPLLGLPHQGIEEKVVHVDSPLPLLRGFRCFVPTAQCMGDAIKHLSSCHNARK